MVNASDLNAYVDVAFDAALKPHGFKRVAARRWVRSCDAPIRGIVTINALKGGQYCPAWGVSSGFAPSMRGRRFARQSTDKNSVMDLVMDPVDLSGTVPSRAYRFVSGYDTAVPTRGVDRCASQIVPLALADLDRIRDEADFCRGFEKRSRLRYKRFPFYSHIQHALVRVFIQLRRGQSQEGFSALEEFCRQYDFDLADKVLVEYLQRAADHAARVHDEADDSSRRG